MIKNKTTVTFIEIGETTLCEFTRDKFSLFEIRISLNLNSSLLLDI